jgi:hypothetical protein
MEGAGASSSTVAGIIAIVMCWGLERLNEVDVWVYSADGVQEDTMALSYDDVEI